MLFLNAIKSSSILATSGAAGLPAIGIGATCRLTLHALWGVLQLLNLFLEELAQEFSQLIKSDLARLVLVQDSKHNTMALILIILFFLIDVDSN